MKKIVIKNRYTIKMETIAGESIEEKVRRATDNKEPIEDGAPYVYTERKDGVRPELNIRTDRFDVALDAMIKVHDAKNKMIAQKMAKREGNPNDVAKAIDNSEGKLANPGDA